MTGQLTAIHFLRGLPPAQLERLGRQCRWRRFGAGEPLVTMDDRSDDVYFLVQGTARVLIYTADGTMVSFRDLAPGGMFGELAAIDGGARSATVEGTSEGVAAVLSGAGFRGLLAAEPALALALLAEAARLVRSLSARVVEFSSLTVPGRLHAELLRQALASGSGRGPIPLPSLTHAEIASRISTHREAVTRELRRLQAKGILVRRGRVLLVADLIRLRDMVENGV